MNRFFEYLLFWFAALGSGMMLYFSIEVLLQGVVGKTFPVLVLLIGWSIVNVACWLWVLLRHARHKRELRYVANIGF